MALISDVSAVPTSAILFGGEREIELGLRSPCLLATCKAHSNQIFIYLHSRYFHVLVPLLGVVSRGP